MKAPARDDFPRPRVGPERRLDRMAEKRDDGEWLAARRADPASRFMLLAGLKLAVDSGDDGGTQIRWLTPSDAAAAGARLEESLLLGCDGDGHAIFAAHLSEGDLGRRADAGAGLKPLVDLRSLAMQGALEPEGLALAGAARALAAWHGTNRCCGRCGAYMRARSAGWRRECRACGQSAFPRMDPAVIVLIVDPDGARCLLGHHKRYAHKFYSVLAGFVEPGEDVEACVRREMREEAGIDIGEVRYMATQPWPFPHSLMIGCWAQALTTGLTLEEAELWDARWFTRAEVRAMLEERHPEGITVPGSQSIAHALIRSFVDSEEPHP